jgi:beta-ureidopropionase / N-carbamoyl-L-amino-acid hydrolase
LATIGADPAGGMTRLAYSASDRQGRAWIATQMRNIGMQVTVDAAGNTIGRYPGTELLPPIVLGSHSDTVRQGGRYDGALGVLAGLACIRTLAAQGMRLRHPLEIIDFAAEEATVLGTLGSQAMIGELTPSHLATPAYDGRSCGEHLRDAGFDPDQLSAATREAGSIAAYLELHIEQGDQLEHSGHQIGLVEGIVGIRRYSVRFSGQANHAGTTQMARRQDALVAAAQFILAVREVALQYGIVGTCGTLSIAPNISNVIPGTAELSCEIRSLHGEILDQAERALHQHVALLGGVFALMSLKEPVSASCMLLDVLAACCTQRGLPYQRMPSGAGHDAMCMAKLGPMAMLFVPSRAGISHAPAEYTSPEDCVSGAQVLLDAVIRLDQQRAYAILAT